MAFWDSQGPCDGRQPVPFRYGLDSKVGIGISTHCNHQNSSCLGYQDTWFSSSLCLAPSAKSKNHRAVLTVHPGWSHLHEHTFGLWPIGFCIAEETLQSIPGMQGTGDHPQAFYCLQNQVQTGHMTDLWDEACSLPISGWQWLHWSFFLESGILSTLALRKFCPSLDFGVCGVKEFSAGKYQKVESRLKILSQFGSINMALHDEFLSDSFQCPLWQKRCSSAFIFNSRTLSRSDGA